MGFEFSVSSFFFFFFAIDSKEQNKKFDTFAKSVLKPARSRAAKNSACDSPCLQPFRCPRSPPCTPWVLLQPRSTTSTLLQISILQPTLGWQGLPQPAPPLGEEGAHGQGRGYTTAAAA